MTGSPVNAVRMFNATIVVLVIIAGFSCRGSTAVHDDTQLASRLLERFETVFGADPSVASMAEGDTLPADVKVFRTAFALLHGSVEVLRTGAATRLMTTAKRVFVAARDFRPPIGLGGIRSQFCYVVMLHDRNAFDLRAYPVQQVNSSESAPLLTWSAQLHEFGETDPRPTVLYAFQLANYIVLCNDVQNTRFVAGQLASTAPVIDQLSVLPDSAAFVQHGLWGSRRYERSAPAVNQEAAGTTEIADDARSLAFAFDTSENAGVLTLLTTNNGQRTANNLNALSRLPRLNERRPGLWEAEIPLTGDDLSAERVMVIMGLFGFGLYL
jgi:hypothetical protein